MNIVKLGPTPLLGINADTGYSGQANYTGTNIVQTGSAAEATDIITFSFNHGLEDGNKVKVTFSGGGTSDGYYYVINKAATTLQISTTSGGSAYDIAADDSSTLVTGNFGSEAAVKDAFTLYTEGNGTRSATISDYFASGSSSEPGDKTNSENQAESLLRSVAVIFSNRKPLTEHNTLDKYLDYCMTSWYGDGLNGLGGDPDNPELNNVGLVGGLLFRCYGMQDGSDSNQDAIKFLPPNYDSQKIYAQALPVVNNTDIARYGLTATSGTAFKAYASGGLCGFTPNAQLGNNIEQRQAGNAGSMITLATCPTFNAYSDWALLESTTSDDCGPFYYGPKQIELPMNTFFNMKFYIDMLSKQSPYTNSYNPYQNFPYTGMTTTALANATTSRIEWDGHGIVDGTKVSFSGISNVTGISNDTAYYVVNSDYPTGANANFRVATTSGGSFAPFGGSDDTGVTIRAAWPYGASEDTLTNIKSGSPMRVVFDTGKPWMPPNGTLEDDMTKNLQFLDIPFTSTKDASETFAEQQNTTPFICKFPKYMTIWVQNYRWIKGAQNTDRPPNDQADKYFFYGDVGASGASMEAEVLIDNIKMVNFEPPTSNFSPQKDGIGGWGITHNGTTSLMSTMKSGNYYGTSMGGYPDDASTTFFKTIENYGATANYVEKKPASYLTIGLDSKDDFAVTGGSSNNYGYLLLSDFWTSNYTDINRVKPAYLLGASGAVLSVATALSGCTEWGGATKLGGQFCGGARSAGPAWNGTTVHASGSVQYDTPVDGGPSVYQVIDSYTDDDTTAPSTQTSADNSLCITTGANTYMSCDGFTQKGFAYWNVSGAAHSPVADSPKATYATWGRRENVLTSTKIISVPVSNDDLDDYQIEVVNPDIFNGRNTDERYIIYKAYKLTGDTDGSKQFQKSNLRLSTDKPIAGSVVSFLTTDDKPFERADDGLTDLLTEANLSELYISPWKYWMTVMFGDFTETDTNLPDSYVGRNYGQIAMVNEVPTDDGSQVGTTWNESLYTYITGAEATAGRSGIYAHNWDISKSPNSSILELETDFGHGAYDEELVTGGYVARQMALSGTYMDMDMSGMVAAGLEENEDFTLFTKVDAIKSDKTVKFTSEESSAEAWYKPRFYWKYYDALPATPFVNIAPAVDLLDKDVNLYDLTSENLNAVRFTWDEGDDDIWYRYFIMGTGSINNKYEGARIWIPLNEEPANQDLSSTSVPWKAYNNVPTTAQPTTSISLTNGGSLTSDLNGMSGWAPNFDDTEDSWCKLASGTAGWDFPFSTDDGTTRPTEFSVVAHFTPDSSLAGASGDDMHWVFGKGRVLASGVDLADGIGLYLKNADTNAPYLIFVQGTGTLESPPIVLDGSPINVIYTYLSGNKTGPDAHLYVNGSLVDSASTMPHMQTPGQDADLFIGREMASTDDLFKGTIEEIIFYDRALVVAEKPGELLYNTSNLADVDAAMDDVLNHNAKLFLFDYHNVRGKSRREVTSSNQLSWRATRV